MFCHTRVSAPDITIPARETTKSTFCSAASINAIVPPSLCPITPTLSKRVLRSSIPASASFLKSSVVQSLIFPLYPLKPLSSYLKVAIPSLARASAITANGLCSKISSSRFCCPLPVTIMRTGVVRLYPSGSTRVPLRATSPFMKVTSSVVYGNGPRGVWGRFGLSSPGIRVKGNDMPDCLKGPTTCCTIYMPS